MKSKLLGQSILVMHQLPSMDIPVYKKDWLRQGRSIYLVASSKSIIQEKVNVVVSKPTTFVKIDQP